VHEGTESIILNLTPDVSNDPPSYAVGVGSATVYILDQGSRSYNLSRAGFSELSGSVGRKAGFVNVPVTLSAASALPVSVEILSGDGGTAFGYGIDYQAYGWNAYVFAGRKTLKTVPVQITPGIPSRANVSLVMGLRNASNAVLGSSGYTLTIDSSLDAALPSTNANLAGLVVSAGTLTPGFASGLTGYAVTVPNGTVSANVTPSVADSTASVKVNGVSVASGTSSAPVPLVVGVNVITTVVTAQDGMTTKTYTVTVTRLPSTNADLAGLVVSTGTLSPGFASGVTGYAVTVPNGTVSANVTHRWPIVRRA